ncbi:hypothetical protein BCR36DRAFT_465744, partial [Piromyces finnis]
SSESDIEECIIEYYNNNNYNLCIIHFDVYECKHLNHVNYLIENIESSKNENELKPIILIIHIKRITINNENNIENEEDRIQNEYLISHLTNWQQFFIDNLNGKITNLNDIICASKNELFKNKTLIDLDEEFKNELYHSFTFIHYNDKINFTDISKEEYINKVCDLIIGNKVLMGNIFSLVLNKINSIHNNIIMEVFEKYNFEENDIDFISVLIKHMKNIYKNAIICSLIQLENLNIFSTLLSTNKCMKNKYFGKIYQENIKKLKEESTLTSQTISQVTNIDLILGISYPCIIPVFDKINKYIVENLKNDYFKNENLYITKSEDDYKKEKYIFEMNIKRKFDEQYFADIFLYYNKKKLNILDRKKLLQILFEDYIIYYLSKSNNKFKNKKILRFFDTLSQLFEMINNENENEDDYEEYSDNDIKLLYEKLTKFILFIETFQKIYYHYS